MCWAHALPHSATRVLHYHPFPSPVQDFLLPENARKVVRDMLLSLVVCPPSFAVAAAVREVTQTLSECAHMEGRLCGHGAQHYQQCTSCAQIPQTAEQV
jgi:hypothetical protein